MKSAIKLWSIFNYRFQAAFNIGAKQPHNIPITPISNPKYQYLERYSKHRPILPLYDLEPTLNDLSFVEESAILAGNIEVHNNGTVWFNAVIKGDENAVKIGAFSHVFEGTVIYTCKSLPTGIAASVDIGNNVVIGSNCVIYSCHIANDVRISPHCVIMEGARLERGCVVAPGSVVPPGRMIPTCQLWGGNPVEYLRDLNDREQDTNLNESYIYMDVARDLQNEYSQYPSTHLHREVTTDDVNPEEYIVRKKYAMTGDKGSQAY